MRRPRAATAPSVAGPNRNAPECEVDTDHYHAAIERMVRAAGEGNFRRCMLAAMDEWIERKERDEAHRAGEG